MDREQILKMSREEKTDEGAVYAENKGRRYGVLGFYAMYAVIMCYNFFLGLDNYVLFSLFWGFAACEGFGKYCALKSRAYLVTAVFGGLSSILFFAAYVIKTWQ